MFRLRKYGVSNFIIIFFMVFSLGVYSDYAMAQENSKQLQSEQTDPFKDAIDSASDLSEDEHFKQTILVSYFTESVIWVRNFNAFSNFPDYPSSYWQPPKN